MFLFFIYVCTCIYLKKRNKEKKGEVYTRKEGK